LAFFSSAVGASEIGSLDSDIWKKVVVIWKRSGDNKKGSRYNDQEGKVMLRLSNIMSNTLCRPLYEVSNITRTWQVGVFVPRLFGIPAKLFILPLIVVGCLFCSKGGKSPYQATFCHHSLGCCKMDGGSIEEKQNPPPSVRICYNHKCS